MLDMARTVGAHTHVLKFQVQISDPAGNCIYDQKFPTISAINEALPHWSYTTIRRMINGTSMQHLVQITKLS